MLIMSRNSNHCNAFLIFLVTGQLFFQRNVLSERFLLFVFCTHYRNWKIYNRMKNYKSKITPSIFIFLITLLANFCPVSWFSPTKCLNPFQENLVNIFTINEYPGFFSSQKYPSRARTKLHCYIFRHNMLPFWLIFKNVRIFF